MMVFIKRGQQRHFLEEREEGRCFFIFFGISKALLGVFLLTVFYPRDCGGVGDIGFGFAIYGIAVLIVACYWFTEAAFLSNVTPASASTEMTVDRAQAPVGTESV
jgi:hypothetical protein